MTRYAVVGLDTSDGGRMAARWAAREAAARGLALRMVTVVPPESSQNLSGAEPARQEMPDVSPAGSEVGAISRAYPDLDLAAGRSPGGLRRYWPMSGKAPMYSWSEPAVRAASTGCDWVP